MTHHLTGNEPMVKEICNAAFPSYNGRMYKLRTQETIDVRSYWDGGSRDYYTFVRLSDMSAVAIPQQSAFDKQIPGADNVKLADGIACVQHTIFCGKDMGLTIIVNPATLNPTMIGGQLRYRFSSAFDPT